MKDAFFRRFVIISLLTLLLICGGFLGLKLYIDYDATQSYMYTFVGSDAVSADGALSFKFTTTKRWSDNTFHAQTPFGAQYDGVITNNTGSTLSNWSVKLLLSDSAIIDSSWNGTFDIYGSTLGFTPNVTDTTTVGAGREGTFGAVMYSAEELKCIDCTLTCHWQIDYAKTICFKLLLVASMLWFASALAFLFVHLRMHKYRIRQENDERIILQSMNTFVNFIDAKDSYTQGHS